MKKRKQHYVWEHYLTAWATENRIWCRRDGKKFQTNTDNVANRRDYYRLREMSQDDLLWVRTLLVDHLKTPQRETAENWITLFNGPFLMQQKYLSSGRSNPDTEKALDIAFNNLEEDLHASIEAGGIPVLKAMKEDPWALLNDQSLFDPFALFIAAQYLRTPAMARSVLKNLENAPGFNVEASWGLMRTICATLIGFEINRRQDKIMVTVLHTTEDSEFITGDQPVVNVRAINLQDGATPEELEFYYPLDPNRAVLLFFNAPSRELIERHLSADEVTNYNKIIASASVEQVYASSKEVLDSLNAPS